jgi:hypothetical protein
LQPALQIKPIDLARQLDFEVRRLAELLAFHLDLPAQPDQMRDHFGQALAR